MGCIETVGRSDGIRLDDEIKSNMGCIETSTSSGNCGGCGDKE